MDNSQTSFTSFTGATGNALALNTSTPTANTVILTYTVAAGYNFNAISYSFWNRSSSTGFTNWSMSINGIPLVVAFAGMGPYITIGLGGRNSYQGTYGDINPVFVSTTNRIHFGDNEMLSSGAYTSLQKFDFVFNFSTGIEVNSSQEYCNYGIGLRDINSNSEKRDNIRENRVLSFGIGYNLKM